MMVSIVELQRKYVASQLYCLIGINCDSPTDDDFVMLSPPMAGVYNMQAIGKRKV